MGHLYKNGTLEACRASLLLFEDVLVLSLTRPPVLGPIHPARTPHPHILVTSVQFIHGAWPIGESHLHRSIVVDNINRLEKWESHVHGPVVIHLLYGPEAMNSVREWPKVHIPSRYKHTSANPHAKCEAWKLRCVRIGKAPCPIRSCDYTADLCEVVSDDRPRHIRNRTLSITRA